MTAGVVRSSKALLETNGLLSYDTGAWHHTKVCTLLSTHCVLYDIRCTSKRTVWNPNFGLHSAAMLFIEIGE